MSSTFDRLADIIAENTDVERDAITMDSHLTEDLGLDSIDMFDVTFAIDKAFDVEVPVEEWAEKVEKGEVPAEHYFLMRNFCARIEELAAQASA
ncbi:acyl carrier protein [Paralimibaculum aggregatum]|uniref:Acyl carrier protein n=1 Tax=Paralimibaculum aggregatum TaxID=3036245 RepID=A0ABQ6LR14_9RHOB|nr:acyl carrier protein [Limibaculum sp. NKW23]GMG83290.1 acyl carrier protein [Limibaculum sp. NKW23]